MQRAAENELDLYPTREDEEKIIGRADPVGRLMRGRRMAGVYGPPGTLVLHEGNIMHGSSDNISPMPRTNLFFVYNSVHNKPAPRPFAAPRFRPEFLGSADRDPLKPAQAPWRP
ncbi:MAG: hypothetical protein ACNS63_11215 [Candidatus Nitrospinota bacterium M3_3B_026]